MFNIAGSPLRTTSLCLAVSAVLLACASCSSTGKPDTSADTSHSGGTTIASPSSSATDSAGDSSDSSQPKPGFCTDIINTPSDNVGGDNSATTDEQTLKSVATYWHHTADEAPAEVKEAALTVASGYDKLVAENATVVDSSPWQDALQTFVGYEIGNCYQ